MAATWPCEKIYIKKIGRLRFIDRHVTIHDALLCYVDTKCDRQKGAFLPLIAISAVVWGGNCFNFSYDVDRLWRSIMIAILEILFYLYVAISRNPLVACWTGILLKSALSLCLLFFAWNWIISAVFFCVCILLRPAPIPCI